MKFLKKLGLAAMAAVALTALAGSSASATVLCTATKTPCPAENRLGAGTRMDGSLTSGSSAVFKSQGGSTLFTCSQATIGWKLENAGSGTETVKGAIAPADVEWTSCTTTMRTIVGGSIEIHHIAGTDNGTVTVSGVVTEVLLFGTSCLYGYGVGRHIGVVTGGPSPTLDVNIVLPEAEPKKFICPDIVFGEASGVLTEPKGAAVYVEPA
jgi:hypothetical protein